MVCHTITGRKKSVAEKKFTVDVPDHVAHDMSPMDVDSPLVMIRNKMTKKPIHVQDIDAMNDPLKSSVYAQDIIEYLQAVERRSIFPSNFLLEKNREVTPHVRTVLMDWLIQVQNHQELSQFTLHLCANLIDKFLAKQRVLLNVVQLVGITALLLAAKYYERFPPDIVDLCRLTDDTYVPDQVLKMERCMLRKLDFDLNMPGPIVFVERFLMVNDCENKHLIESMSVFLLDLTLTELSYVHFCPSMLAASAIYVARGLLACAELWNPSFVHYTKYTEKDLDECVRMIRKSLSKLGKSKFQGARTKFAHHSYHGISKHHSVLTAINLWPEEENDVFECEGTLV
ncbi:uncharacterized protein LOC128237629 [Mya arenaria]|uniref:uncharacterized protein LOC128237629 n=1 Tax=Mya arenaria TaxID=6604 RepID=UPI0022E8759A|nr:uncharacterized protein LOC128237629 [Mya arenaria]